MRFLTVLTATWVVAVALSPARADDIPAIKARLDKERTAYEADLEAARTNLIAVLQQKEEAAKKSGDLARLKQVRAEQEAFAGRGELPKSVGVNDYLTAQSKARGRLKAAYLLARKECTRAGDVAEAEAIEAELERLAPGKDNPPVGPAPAKAAGPRVVATWAHQVGRGKDATRSTFKFYSNGHINSPDGRATWHVTGRVLTMKWPNPKAPGGAWDDVCVLASDGKSYAGKNDKGTPTFGVLLAAGDTDAEKKK